MKQIIFLITFFLLAVSGYSQVQIETAYDTTRADGQRFVITYPYDIRIQLVDSIKVVRPDSVEVTEYDSVQQKIITYKVQPPDMTVYVYPYYSKLNSKVIVKCQRKRIVSSTNAEDNTIIKYEWVTVPFALLGVKVENLLNGLVMKKALKPTMKSWIKYNLNQE